MSTILATVAEKTFSGPIFTEIKAAFPQAEVVERTTMNSWDDGRITDIGNRITRRKSC